MSTNLSRVLVVAAMLLFAGCAHLSRTDKSQEAIMIEPAVDVGTLKTKIARYAQVEIPYRAEKLSERQHKAVQVLVRASRIIDDLFWEQASDVGLKLRARLKDPRDETERLLAHYLAINYGPYDRLDGMEPFIKVPSRPKGATFYPNDLTKQEFQSWIQKHPGDKEAFQGWFTVIRRKENRLVAVPYSTYYRPKLQEASRLLKEAAGLVENASLATYLASRAESLLSNEYRQSDMDWMDVKDSILEVTIGPYEVYEDHLFNYKAAFESFVTIRDEEESNKLSLLAGYLEDLESNLPVPEEHKNFERGKSSPFVVAELVYAAGDTRAGVQTLAFNLPNDEKVREIKGSKKVMLKNISHAKFDMILTPIAARVIADHQLNQVTFDAYFHHTLMHEISHGLGPGRILHQGEKVSVSLLLKDEYSTIEEAKADVLGAYNTLYLVGEGVLPEQLGKQCPVTFLAGVFRSVRFGVHESHGRANLVAFNYLLEKGAYRFDTQKGRFEVDEGKFTKSIKNLAKDLLLLEALGDYDGAKAFVEKYAVMGPAMQSVLNGLSDIPVDIEPVFEIEQGLSATQPQEGKTSPR